MQTSATHFEDFKVDNESALFLCNEHDYLCFFLRLFTCLVSNQTTQIKAKHFAATQATVYFPTSY
jgi:hypothetical protein